MINRLLRSCLAAGSLVAVGALSGCAGSEGDTSGGETTPITLETLAGNWETDSAQGADGPVELDRAAILKIQADGAFTIDAGCNNLGGTFSVEDGQLYSSPLRSTRMACPEPIASFEHLAGEILTGVTAAELRSENFLIFEAPAGELKFQKK